MRNFCYALLLLGLILVGCNISDIDTNFGKYKIEEFNADFAVPFGFATYTMGELLSDLASFDLEEDSVGNLTLIYRDTAEYELSTSLFGVNDLIRSNNISVPDITNPIGSGTTIDVDETVSFTQTYESIEFEVLDSVFHAETARLVIGITSTSALDVQYTLEMSDTRNRATNLPITFSGTVNSANPANQESSLEDHKTQFTLVEIDEMPSNQYDMNIRIQATLNEGDAFLNDDLDISISFLDQDFIAVFGEMGLDTVAVSNNRTSLSFFDETAGTGLEFGNPTITMDFRNSLGHPLSLDMSGVFSQNTNGNTVFMTGSIVDNFPLISGATTDPLTGEPVQSIIEINARNSNLQELMAVGPSTIGFDISGYTNFEDPTAKNFVSDTSSIRTYIEMELPMEVSMTDVTQSLDIDAGNLKLKQVDSLVIRTVMTSDFPFAATMDFYVVDGDTLYQYLNSGILDQPELNIDRTVKEPEITIEDIVIGVEGINALADGGTIRLVFRFNTPVSQTSEEIYVKLMSTAQLTVQLAARTVIKRL